MLRTVATPAAFNPPPILPIRVMAGFLLNVASTLPSLFRFGAPRLFVRTLAAMFGALLAIFVVLAMALTLEARGRAARTAAHRLDGMEALFSALEARRGQELVVQNAVVSRNPVVVDALARSSAGYAVTANPVLERELTRLAETLDVDVLVVSNDDGIVLASGGPRRVAWATGQPARDSGSTIGGNGPERIERRGGGYFRVVSAPIRVGSYASGELYTATALDDDYALSLSRVARADIALLLRNQPIAATLPATARNDLGSLVGNLPEGDALDLGGSRYILKTVRYLGPIRYVAVAPLEAHDGGLGGTSPLTFVLLGLGALVLSAVASLWVARSIANPIDTLSQQLTTMARARDFSRQLQVTGSSREVDGLTQTFNQMMAAVSAADAQTELTYVGAIKALAAALDARDPYTAGHSERVSALSVMVGRQMRLGDDELEVLRLGALLHDIGKIGIRDNVLTKAGALTREEFDIIKTHPTLGAHILRQVPFLCRHLPIVELHHERPDGRGYPHGLIGHATPLLARIVHVADAFDAMTSARAYRGAQETSHAIAELWRYAGSQFDAEVVEAFVAAWTAASPPAEQSVPRSTPVLRLQPTGSEG
jgi:putative nucleotidyltransferase with HDIG domain